MKLFKVALALLLAAGVVFAYLYFPNPMEQQVEAMAKEKPRPAEATEPAAGGELH